MSDDRVRRRVVVGGRVQGVFFRDSTRREAQQRGVSGWARNLPDGRVEVVLEGGPDEVAAVLSWLRDGPPHARVARRMSAAKCRVHRTRPGGHRAAFRRHEPANSSPPER